MERTFFLFAAMRTGAALCFRPGRCLPVLPPCFSFRSEPFHSEFCPFPFSLLFPFCFCFLVRSHPGPARLVSVSGFVPVRILPAWSLFGVYSRPDPANSCFWSCSRFCPGCLCLTSDPAPVRFSFLFQVWIFQPVLFLSICSHFRFYSRLFRLLLHLFPFQYLFCV